MTIVECRLGFEFGVLSSGFWVLVSGVDAALALPR